jgi:hypothetical protein
VSDFAPEAKTGEARIVRCLFALAELAVAAPGYHGPPLVLPSADVVDNDQHLADTLARRLAPSMSVRRRVPPALPPRAGASFAAASDDGADAPTPSKSESSDALVGDAPSTPPPLEPTKSMVAARVNSCLGKLTTEQLARLVLAVRHLQRAIRATRARLAEQKAARAQMFRDRVADEILKSEREYVSSLLKCADLYLKPFRSSKAVSKEQVTEVFSGVFETIVLLSRTLLSDLELRMTKWSPDTLLGDIFIKIVDFMKVYVGYIENFDTSIRVRQELLKSKRYRALLEKCAGEPGERHDLASFLIMPVQRLPRYILLLRELYKHTPPTHADEPLLAKAVEKVSAVAEFVNEKKRSAEQLMQLMALQQQLKPDKERWAPFAIRGRGLTRLGVFDLLALGAAAPNVPDVEPEQRRADAVRRHRDARQGQSRPAAGGGALGRRRALRPRTRRRWRRRSASAREPVRAAARDAHRRPARRRAL